MVSWSTGPCRPSEHRSTRSPGSNRSSVGPHEDVFERADRHGQHVAVGHGAQALFAEAELGAQLIGEILVVGKLAQLAAAIQVGAAIAHVGDDHFGAVPHRHHDGGAHAVALGAHFRRLDHLAIGGADRLLHHLFTGEPGLGRRHVFPDCAHRDRRAHFAATLSAHAVGEDGDGERLLDMEGVLVVLALPSAMRGAVREHHRLPSRTTPGSTRSRRCRSRSFSMLRL